MARTILLTGSTGYLGKHVVEKLLAKGEHLLLTLRPESIKKIPPSWRDKVTTVSSELSAEELSAEIKRFGVEEVLHLATLFIAEHKPSDVPSLIQSNIEFPSRVAEAALLAGTKKFLNIGTYWQHHEKKSFSPTSLYAATKQSFEDILKFYSESRGFSVINLSFAAVYGPNDPRAKVVNLFLKAASTGEKISLSPGEQILDLLFVDDAVDAVLTGRELFVEQTSFKTYSVSSGKMITLRQVAAEVELVTKKKLYLEWGAKPYRDREFFQDWRFDEPLPGWSPKINLRAGLRRLGT